MYIYDVLDDIRIRGPKPSFPKWVLKTTDATEFSVKYFSMIKEVWVNVY